jgi:hypothetical protein
MIEPDGRIADLLLGRRGRSVGSRPRPTLIAAHLGHSVLIAGLKTSLYVFTHFPYFACPFRQRRGSMRYDLPFGVGRIQALGPSDTGSEVEDVMERMSEFCAFGGRPMPMPKRSVYRRKRLIVGIGMAVEFEPAAPADLDSASVRSLYAHHVVAGKIERLSRQVWQRPWHLSMPVGSRST